MYHPIMGITIFILAVVISFVLGRLYIRKKLNLPAKADDKKNNILPKGEITAPDAPWLDKK